MLAWLVSMSTLPISLLVPAELLLVRLVAVSGPSGDCTVGSASSCALVVLLT